MYNDCTDHTAQMTCVHGSSLSCVPKIGHSSSRHVSPCASQHTEHQHKFFLSLSLRLLLCYCRPLLRTQTCCPRIHLSTMKIHGRMVLPRHREMRESSRWVSIKRVRAWSLSESHWFVSGDNAVSSSKTGQAAPDNPPLGARAALPFLEILRSAGMTLLEHDADWKTRSREERSLPRTCSAFRRASSCGHHGSA